MLARSTTLELLHLEYSAAFVKHQIVSREVWAAVAGGASRCRLNVYLEHLSRPDLNLKHSIILTIEFFK